MTEQPTKQNHQAVALRYDEDYVPRVTAKGQGELATRIVETAKAHGVPIEEDPVLAEALSHIPLEEDIPETLYQAVAEVLGFILRTRGKL